MPEVADWLKKLGMSEYAQRFADSDIDIDVLSELTDQDFDRLGVSLGHRRRMLRAIRELDASPIAAVAERQASAQTAPEPALKDTAERRQVTVMFSDLVGSTALAARMDPEDLREVISAYQKCVAVTVDRFDGFVAKYMGDGVLVYFGYPQAHEDDAERAVRSGLALIEAVGKLGNVGPLQVRIGIGTGLVVVGDLVGSGEAQERGVVGETPNLAARLQAETTPGTIAIDITTRRLLGGLFEYRDLGGIEAKGFANRVQAYEVVRASMVESRFEALRTATTPLIGRDEEVDLLLRRWEQAKRGDGCVVLISGEPGIGKSRLAETIVERLGGEPHTRLRYFCSPHHQDSALYPSIAQLERAAGFRREDTAEQRLAKLEAVLAQGTNDLSEAVPLLADLLSIPTGDRYTPLNLTPQKRKEKRLHALLAQLEGLAARQPVLMVFEDVHWSDPTTRESLDLLIERVPALRVLVIMTYRPEFAPPWVGRPHVSLVSLSRLAPRRRIEMITRLTGGKALPEEIADQIVDRTDGVPLFIEELTKAVVESGVLTDAGDRYTVAGPLAPLAIPTSLNASLLARLDRLAPVREVAQIAASLGRHFSHELISAVAPMPQQQLDGALEQLVSTELIFRRGSPPNAEYTFKHALVQDAAYSTLLLSRRLQLHARIAGILERQFPEIVETQPEVLARHCASGGLVEKAVGYWLSAGQQAIARWAMTEAVSQVRKGLQLLSGLPKSAARQQQELNLQIALGRAQLATKGYAAPEPGEAYGRARQLCEQLHRPSQFGPVLVGQYLFCAVRGELKQAKLHAEEIRQLGEGQNDVFWKFTGSNLSGIVCLFLGKFTDVRTNLEEALSLWDPKFRASAVSPADGYVSAMVHLSRTLLCLGYIDHARLRMDEALTEARRLSPYNLAFALCFAWYGDWATEGVKSTQTMLRSAEEVLAISSEQGFPLYTGIGNIVRGWCLGATRQATEGIPLLLNGIAICRSTGCNLMLPFFLMTLAEIYGMVEQSDEGLNRLAEAATLVETTQERWAEAEMHRLRGRLLLSAHDPVAAEESYRRALAVARRQSAKFWELRAATSLARLWRDQGKRDEARELLAPVYGWFTEGFDTRDLKEAKALLDELNA